MIAAYRRSKSKRRQIQTFGPVHDAFILASDTGLPAYLTDPVFRRLSRWFAAEMADELDFHNYATQIPAISRRHVFWRCDFGKLNTARLVPLLSPAMNYPLWILRVKVNRFALGSYSRRTCKQLHVPFGLPTPDYELELTILPEETLTIPKWLARWISDRGEGLSDLPMGPCGIICNRDSFNVWSPAAAAKYATHVAAEDARQERLQVGSERRQQMAAAGGAR